MSQEARSSLQPGDTLGPYRIEKQIAQGGMGVVYQAVDTKLNRLVAIKILSADLATADARRRFQREAQMASSLNHPHILTVHDADEFEGRQYLVTEFVDGGTLKEWARAKKRSWQEVVELLLGVADGLAAAHAAGITHRDIKPGNILTSKSGYAKLADFGLAKLTERTEGDATQTMAEAQTVPGTVMGTVAYMSPEQASGLPTDGRSDIFSFGIVLYELLAGRRPFDGATELETLKTIIHGQAQPLSEDVPAQLRMAVEKALEKDPDDRYQTTRDMVTDLRRIARRGAGEPTVATAPVPVVSKQAGRKWAAAASVAVILAIAAGVSYWMLSSTAAGGEIRSIAVLPLDNLSGDPDQEYFSDGTTEVLIANLAQIHALRVISRTTMMRYKGTTKSLPEIGRDLGVDAIVEGSVHRVGDRIRITAQLIEAATDTHLWAQSYERDVADTLLLEAEVARAIADEIRVQITPEEDTRMASARRVNPQALEQHQLGSFYRWKLNAEDIRRAIGHYERAIQIQPDYGAAHAGLAIAWLSGIDYGAFTVGETEAPVRSAAETALSLDPNSSDAHAAMARVKLEYDWDWPGAEREFERALELNPNSLELCTCYTDLLASTGRVSEAVALVERAAENNPLSSAAIQALGYTLLEADRFEEAIPHLQRAVELEARNALAQLYLSLAHETTGDLERALRTLDDARRVLGEDLFGSLPRARVYAKMGRRTEALQVLDEVAGPGESPDLVQLSMVYFALGDRDRGFATLTRAFEERAIVFYLVADPMLDDVRDDPRYEALFTRLRLPNLG